LGKVNLFWGEIMLLWEGAVVFLGGDEFRPKILNGICRKEDKLPSMGVTDKFKNTTVNKRLFQATATDDMT
jgi:hypothetical protein